MKQDYTFSQIHWIANIQPLFYYRSEEMVVVATCNYEDQDQSI